MWSTSVMIIMTYYFISMFAFHFWLELLVNHLGHISNRKFKQLGQFVENELLEVKRCDKTQKRWFGDCYIVIVPSESAHATQPQIYQRFSLHAGQQRLVSDPTNRGTRTAFGISWTLKESLGRIYIQTYRF